MANDQTNDKDIIQTKEELLAALSQDFATSATKIYFNSVDKEYAFREVSVKEQKALTRTMSANENRKDMIYDAQCALINKVALDPTFDIYQFSEFDRIKTLISLYQQNMFQNEVKFTCEECGAENKYTIDFTNTIQKLDNYKLEDKVFEYENSNFKYIFNLSYPTVKLVSRFHASYCAKHGSNVVRKQRKTNDLMTNLEYVNLFIKTINMTNKKTNVTREIAFDNYKVSDIEDILEKFPQDVLYTEKGVLKFIVNEYIKPTNDSFEKHECWQCHTIHEKGNSNSTESFF